MRRITAVLLVVSLLMLLSITVLAATMPTVGFSTENGNTVLSVVDTASCSESQKDFLLEFMSTSQPRTLTYNYTSASDTHNITFAIYPSSFTAFNSTFFQEFSSSYLSIYPPSTSRFMNFKYQNGSWVPTNTIVTTVNANQSIIARAVIFSDIPGLPSSYQYDYSGNFIMRDNDGLLSSGDGESSGGVSDPDIPSAPPAVDFPIIDRVENEYVPYDTTVWNTFLDWVKNSIGSATNIGFILFAYIFGILLVISIVRKFTKG